MAKSYDAIIIGSGAGLTAALYLGRAGQKCVVLEKEFPGGYTARSPRSRTTRATRRSAGST